MVRVTVDILSIVLNRLHTPLSFIGDWVETDAYGPHSDIITFGSTLFFYRKNTEPNGSVFTLTEASLTDDGSWMVESLSPNEMKLYSFYSGAGGTYELFWDDWDYGSSFYSTDIVVSCYQEDQSTLHFEEADWDHYLAGEIVLFGAGETMYVIVEGVDGAESGDFALKLQ